MARKMSTATFQKVETKQDPIFVLVIDSINEKGGSENLKSNTSITIVSFIQRSTLYAPNYLWRIYKTWKELADLREMGLTMLWELLKAIIS